MSFDGWMYDDKLFMLSTLVPQIASDTYVVSWHICSQLEPYIATSDFLYYQCMHYFDYCEIVRYRKLVSDVTPFNVQPKLFTTHISLRWRIVSYFSATNKEVRVMECLFSVCLNGTPRIVQSVWYWLEYLSSVLGTDWCEDICIIPCYITIPNPGTTFLETWNQII